MRTWPHAPSKVVNDAGTYIVTAGTYRRLPLFHDPVRLDLLHDTILSVAAEKGWELQAWAVFANHYHLVGFCPDDGGVRAITSKIHGITARELNRLDFAPRRSVWYRCWDKRITYERSYLARLAYVHSNAVKHSLVTRPQDYPWCSARWFLGTADSPFRDTVMAMRTDSVNVRDDY